MKKVVFLLALVLAAGTAVWAIDTNDISSASDYFAEWSFNAVQTMSVDSRFSVDMFTADMDNYIDTRFFNPAIGTFVFVGGHKNDAVVPPGVSFGYGQTIGKTYLGIYYGGWLGGGDSKKIENDLDDDKIAVTSTGNWNNSVAMLFGIAGMGFRLDFITQDSLAKTTYDGKLTEETTNGKTGIALGWSTSLFDSYGLTPWVRVGYKFPRIATTSNGDSTTAPDYKMTALTESLFGAQAGALYKLTDTDSFVAELNYTLQFPDKYEGDTKYGYSTDPWNLSDGPDPYEMDGGWILGLDAYYQKEIGFGKIPGFTLKLRPRLSADFFRRSQSTTNKLDTAELPTVNWLYLVAGLNVAAEYRYKKIGLYTGFSLDIIDWQTISFSGGDDANKTEDSTWKLSGIGWRDHHNDFQPFSAPVLKFGLTFTPIEGLVIGAGLDAAFDQIFKLNLRTMEISSSGTNYSVTNDRIDGLFSTSFLITVSYKF